MFKFFKKEVNPIGETYSCTWWKAQMNKTCDIQVVAAFLGRLERQNKVVRTIDKSSKKALYVPASGFTPVDIRNELILAYEKWENKA